MSREITTAPPQAETAPTLADDPRSREIVRLRTVAKLDNGDHELDRELTPVEKGHLKQRKMEIARFLRPIAQASEEQRRLAQALAQMFLRYGNNQAEAAARVGAYVEGLADMPMHAVLAALDDIRAGRVDEIDDTFAPTTVQIQRAAKKYTQRAREEVAAIDATLRAQVGEVHIPEERRKALAEDMLAHSQQIREAHDERLDPAKIEERQQKAYSHRDLQILAEYRQHGVEPRYADRGKTMLVSLTTLRKGNPDLDRKCLERERKWSGSR